MELEQGKNVDFWRDMTTITEDEISKLRKLESSGKGPGKICVLVAYLICTSMWDIVRKWGRVPAAAGRLTVRTDLRGGRGCLPSALMGQPGA